MRLMPLIGRIGLTLTDIKTAATCGGFYKEKIVSYENGSA